MIHHVVMWRFRKDTKPAGILSVVDQLQVTIEALRIAIPGMHRLQLGCNCVEVPDAADVILHGEFESWSALQFYEKHPLHDELRTLIGPFKVERRVVDYES